VVSERESIRVRAEVIGRARYDDVEIDIIRSVEEARPQGPAENALLAVERRAGEAVPVGRYISWIGYYDVDVAIESEPHNWLTIEPALIEDVVIRFEPYRRARGSLI